jgi:glycosyltransferase involved in cell wall biosynthesis
MTPPDDADRQAPLLSIITPAYNAAGHLGDCIASVIAASDPSLPIEQQLEHLILDGGSSDGSVPLLEELAGRHPHLRWLSEADSGQPAAINKGLRLARGRFIGHLNADDIYYPGTLQAVRDTLLSSPADLSRTLVIGNLAISDASGTITHTTSRQRFGLYPLLLGEMPINPLSYFYPRQLHQRIGWLDEADHFSHDLDLLIRLAPHLTPLSLPQVFGEFRMVDGSKTVQTIAEGSLQERKLAVIQRHRASLGRRQKLLLHSWRLRNKLSGLARRLQPAPPPGRP